MKERAITFTGDMVRATLEDLKTQTRFAVKQVAGYGNVREFQRSETPGYDYTFRCRRGLWQDFREVTFLKRCPFGSPGDRLYVRETWGINPDEGGVVYRATDPDWADDEGWKWRSPAIMPRQASRLVLEIVSVRVERLQSISEADAIAEGARRTRLPLATVDGCDVWHWGDYPTGTVSATAIDAFAAWCKQNKRRVGDWEENQCQWVIGYRRIANA